jgi:hypothetical protein
MGVELQAGDSVVVEYVSGVWNNGTRQDGFDGDGPPDRYVCAEYMNASDCVEPVPDFQAGALVGRVGRQLLAIGNRLSFVVETSGHLELRMNDGDPGLNDNQGSIVVRVTVR